MTSTGDEKLEPSSESQKPAGSLAGWSKNHALVRKFETLVFGCMLALLPFFALKVVNVTKTALDVKDTVLDLTRVIRRARELAKEHGVYIKVKSREASNLDPSAFLIQDRSRTIEETVIRRGVTATGEVLFDAHGLPVPPRTCSFTIKKGQKDARLVVDANGVISAP